MKKNQGLFSTIILCLLTATLVGLVDYYVPLFPRLPRATTKTTLDGGQ